jgi:hypothetical protein
LAARPVAAAFDASHIAAVAAVVRDTKRQTKATLADKREAGILLRGGGGERANDCQTHAVATRFRSSGKTFFLRGLTGRRCSGDDVEGDETSGLAGGFDGLGMFWHRAAAESKQSIIRNPQSTMDDLIESCRGR